MNDDTRTDILGNVELARETLAEMRGAVERGRYRIAVSHLYYACFYYLRALLLTKGAAYQSHKGVIVGFNLFFVKEGLAPRDMGAFLRKLGDDRQEADYRFGKYKREDVEARIKKADAFIVFAEAYLKKAVE
jgi:uncharacterized protein (UPF0332 family)